MAKDYTYRSIYDLAHGTCFSSQPPDVSTGRGSSSDIGPRLNKSLVLDTRCHQQEGGGRQAVSVHGGGAG